MKIWGQKGRNNLKEKYIINCIIPNETEFGTYVKGNTTDKLTGKYYELFCKNKGTLKNEILNIGINEARLIIKDLNLTLPPQLSLYYNNNIANSGNTNKTNNIKNINEKYRMPDITYNIIIALNILKKSIIYKKRRANGKEVNIFAFAYSFFIN